MEVEFRLNSDSNYSEFLKRKHFEMAIEDQDEDQDPEKHSAPQIDLNEIKIEPLTDEGVREALLKFREREKQRKKNS